MAETESPADFVARLLQELTIIQQHYQSQIDSKWSHAAGNFTQLIENDKQLHERVMSLERDRQQWIELEERVHILETQMRAKLDAAE